MVISFAQPAITQQALAYDFGNASSLPEIQEYARDNNIDLDEAVYRFDLMDDTSIDDLEKRLSVQQDETLGGLWFQHQPTFRIVIAFTSNGENTIQSYVNDQPWSHLVQVCSVPVALVELQDLESTTANTLQELGIKFYSDINILEGYVEFNITDQAQFDTARQGAKIELPERVRVFEVDQLIEPEADVYGGLGVTFYIGSDAYLATTGFSVQNVNTGEAGILTTGHAGPYMYYNGTFFPRRGGQDSAYYDFQWHATPGYTPKASVKDNNGTRPVTGTKDRNSQQIGEFVCKYGASTQFTCGYITSKTVRPSGYYEAAFIKVHRDGVDLSSGGDSGCPWYKSYTAYGIHHGGSGNDAYYMAINYISDHYLIVRTW